MFIRAMETNVAQMGLGAKDGIEEGRCAGTCLEQCSLHCHCVPPRYSSLAALPNLALFYTRAPSYVAPTHPPLPVFNEPPDCFQNGSDLF